MKYGKALIMGILFFISTSMAETKKSVLTRKVDTVPLIDGIIDEAVWQTVQPATDFYRYEPESGGFAPVRTEVRFLYDDISLYVAAKMYDPDPGSIPTQLGKRDDDDVVADWLGLWLNPFNDGANEVGFLVTAAGVQVDQKFGPSGDDSNWDPVWESAVSFDAEGWSVEMAIPFSQIRFPARDVQVWGLNIARRRAAIREIYTWTFLDKEKDNFAQQAGLLRGIENIETPLRLAFTPYASVSTERYPLDSGEQGSSQTYRGGMDLQYGINESFTLDMTLIPDFGQVQSDNVELNLSPFEIYYDEHRPFFTEGTQLLHKANIFYSRRVGSQPIRHWQVDEGEILKEGETVTSNPDLTQLINATKVTGQTVDGIGLGFFNAITAPANATIVDSVGNEREYLTNPTTNYNLLVVSKNLQNGSDFSVINTNVQRFSSDDTSGDFRDANVIGFETRLVSADSKWVIQASGSYNKVSYDDSSSTGYTYFAELAEKEAIFQYEAGLAVESEHYDPNDMGFLSQPNEVVQYAEVSWRTIDPVWIVNNAELEIDERYTWLYRPWLYSQLELQADYNVTFKNYFSVGGGTTWRPKDAHDHYEPRVAGRFLQVAKYAHSHLWFDTNQNKPFAISAWAGRSTTTSRGTWWRGAGVSPRWRVNNQFQINYNLDLDMLDNDFGFAEFDDQDNPVIGRRNHNTLINTLNSQFIFSRNLESDIRMRYYRSTVEYKDYYDLLEDGDVRPRDYAADLSEVFNAFTIDAVMTWRFAPGSELNIIFKNAIYADGDDPGVRFFEDLSDLGRQDQSNSISVKLLYYVDSWALKHRLK
ncbi:MAG: carbohydrate binding family 9 domain-containing protein [Candidatus Marinimicrobia bacterium]|nr:carbohydrate binding family 9 domain-containing protein [Candidatus Neomarinimicrobiota bacterium]